jgi:CHAD domain-containing protein
MKENITNHLSNYYSKEIDLFLEHLITANTVLTEKNIHQLRVDIKRIRSVFQFLEVIVKQELNTKQYTHCLKKLFINAGKLREIQVNRVCITKYRFPKEITEKYKKYLSKKEQELSNRLKKTIKDFDDSVLKKSKKLIKKTTFNLNNKKICDESLSYIKDKTRKIEKLLSAGNKPVIIHRIRMQLKSLHTIVSFLQKTNPSEKLEKTLKLIKQTGVLIGNWHDKLILINSLEIFFIKKEKITENELPVLEIILNKIETENNLILKNVKNKINSVVRTIHKSNYMSLTGT